MLTTVKADRRFAHTENHGLYFFALSKHLLYSILAVCILPVSLLAEDTMNARNSRNGIILFAVYLLFYGGFVFVNAFDPVSMEKTPFAGLNVAILYGFALIIGAVAMSVLYGFLCGDMSKSSKGTDSKNEEPQR